MAKKFFLTPGPSELYFTVPDHIQTALKENVASISHRSKAFEGIFSHAVSQLRALLNVPDNFHIVFTNSATEIWERLLQNCVEEHSFHLVNGSFSKRFFEFTKMSGKNSEAFEVPFGKGFEVDKIEVPSETEMICVTHNETSSGVTMPLEDIYQMKAKNPDALLAIDAVSIIPYPEFDFTQIDSVYFSVQKGMGLPAGLGVWIFNEKLVEKANLLQSKGLSIGTYHSIPSLLDKAVKNQTPATPNVLGIYLLGKVCEDMLRRGIQEIRNDTNFKAAFIYNAINESTKLKPFVEEKAHRSKTVIVADTIDTSSQEIIDLLGKKGFVVGSGYGKYKSAQIRIANFPTHSKEIFLMLTDLLKAL